MVPGLSLPTMVHTWLLLLISEDSHWVGMPAGVGFEVPPSQIYHRGAIFMWEHRKSPVT